MPNELIEEESLPTRQRLFKMLSPGVQSAIMGIPDEYLISSELELEKIAKPTHMDYMLRHNLWKKFKEAELKGVSKISNTEVYEGVCSNQNFYKGILKNPAKLAWLLYPVNDVTTMMEEALQFGIAKIRMEILTQTVTEKNAGAILKAIEFLANRTWGAAIQRIEQKNLNVNVGATQVTQMTHDEIEAKLREVQQLVSRSHEKQITASPTEESE